MKKFTGKIYLFALALLFSFTMLAGCPAPNGNGNENENGNGDNPPALTGIPGIEIHRGDSSATEFVFRVNPGVTGATNHQALKNGSAIVTVAGTNNITVPGAQLNDGDDSPTMLTARGIRTGANAADGPQTDPFPAMVRYGSTPVVNAVKDWTTFLNIGLTILEEIVDSSEFTSNHYSALAAAGSAFDTPNVYNTNDGTADTWLNGGTRLTNFRSVTPDILSNYNNIVNFINANKDMVDEHYASIGGAAGALKLFEESVLRLWFNNVEGTIDTASNAAFKTWLLQQYPAVKDVS